MLQAAHYHVRVLWACLKKEIKSSWTERSTLLQCITLPVNYLILLSLFVLSGSHAPTEVVLQEHGSYARQFYTAMEGAHSFRLSIASATHAQADLLGGKIVAVITIPADFDARIANRQPIQVKVRINNLNQDLTDDVRRAMRLSITSFYAHTFPDRVNIVPAEQDAYPQDTEYIPFLAISILVISLMVTGLLQAGMGAAREWEQGTIKELLLAPVGPWVLVLGKMLGAFVMGLLPAAVVLLVLVLIVGDLPIHPGLAVGVSLLTLLVFVAAGVTLGMGLKSRITLTTLTRGITLPLFFLSGIFAPIAFSTPALQVLARLSPIHYAVVLEQFAFKGFVTNTLGLVPNCLLLAGFAAFFLFLATLSLRPLRGAY